MVVIPQDGCGALAVVRLACGTAGFVRVASETTRVNEEATD